MGRWLSPRYSEDGRIAFSHPRERLHFFDGKEWSSADNLLTAQKPFRAEIRPFFNRTGRLAWNYNGRFTRELDEKEGWQDAEFEDHPDAAGWEDEKKPPLPRGVIDKPASHAQDRLGSTWLVAQHRLYRALPGVSVPMIGGDEANPFADGRSLDQVFIAKNGEITLLTDRSERAEYLRLRFDSPPPETEARLAAVEADSAIVEIESDVALPRWFRWRLDGGPWSEPLAETRLTLDSLPAGEHRCEIAALDRSLRADPMPAAVTFTIQLSDAERLARLIAELKAGDYEKREAAVRLLARQPTLAVPALRARRAAATHDERWWIDAAIREAGTVNPAK